MSFQNVPEYSRMFQNAFQNVPECIPECYSMFQPECIPECSTGCPTKKFALFWRAIEPIKFELGIKVGSVLESSGSQL